VKWLVCVWYYVTHTWCHSHTRIHTAFGEVNIHGSFIFNITHMWHNSYVTLLVCVCEMTRVWLDSCVCVTWLVCVCDMTHSYRVRGGQHTQFFQTWHNSYVKWLIVGLIGARTHMWNDSYVKWLVCVCDMTHPYQLRGGQHTRCPQALFVRDPRSLLCWEFVIVRWPLEMYIQICVICHIVRMWSKIQTMGWLRLVGSIKL